MRNIVILTSMALGVMTTATHASSSDGLAHTLGTSGFVEMFGFHSNGVASGSNLSDADDNYTGGGGGSSVNFWLTDSLTLQIDGNFSYFRNDPDNDTEHAIEMVVHTGWRDTELGYLGTFGGLVSFGYAGDGGSGGKQWVLGGEGAVYLGMITVFAQAGFMDTFDHGNSEPFEETFFVQGGVRYFVNPNMKLEASGGIVSGKQYENTSFDMPFWRAEVEYKPDDARISWFAAYEGYTEDEPGFEHNNHTVMAGLRIHFGQDTLMSFDRSGASQGFLNSRMLQMAFDQ